MTIPQRYPMLMLDKCSGISGYYCEDTMMDSKKFTINTSSQEYKVLSDLIYDKKYHRSIWDLLPRGTRFHRQEMGDFQWEVYFNDIELADGSPELTSADKIEVKIEHMDVSMEPKDGDVIEIIYSGEIIESYPAGLQDVYSIRLVVD